MEENKNFEEFNSEETPDIQGQDNYATPADMAPFAAAEPAKAVFESDELVDEAADASRVSFTGEDFSSFDTPQPIEFSPTVTESDKANKRGLRVFILLLCIIIAISGAAAGGYFAGKVTTKNPANGENSLLLESKPVGEDALAYETIYENVNKSVVGIVVYNDNGVQGYASGVVYSEDGYIITNDHIYEDVASAKFKIYTFDGNIYDATFKAGDTRSDLAVLKVNSAGFFPATFGNSDEINCGETVLAIGRPNDATANSSVTEGIVSYTDRRVTNSTNYSSKLIETDSAINPGSSGGALVNLYGQVVGITSLKVVGDEYEGIGYAIPTTTVKRVVESLIENGKVIDRARLGISYQEVDAVTAAINKTSTGLLVASVTEDSDLFGKVGEGDIITHVNGDAITRDDVILDVIEANKPGEVLEFTVITKDGKTVTVSGRLLADEGGSSYISEENNLLQGDDGEGTGGGTFDFPYGY